MELLSVLCQLVKSVLGVTLSANADELSCATKSISEAIIQESKQPVKEETIRS